MAAKSGVPDPELNQSLKKEIERAKKEHIPADVIKRAIEKAKGGIGEAYNFVRYEGYGPNNCMVMVDCLSDNVNRTYTAVKTAFGRAGFKMGVSGCVSYMFDNLAVFTFKGHTDEEVLEALMMADVEVKDVELDEEYVTVYAPQSSYTKVRDALTGAFGEIEFDEDETTWIPQNYVELDDEGMRKFHHFEELLDDIDDVQDLYHNIQRK
ncbi:probable transcriptional regulatory protein PSM_B0061 [Coprobacillus sp. CAG:698]|nr:probable transcriptional regulatory protein PSM_B0061 [Coprobacillus sp. CAG:698]